MAAAASGTSKVQQPGSSPYSSGSSTPASSPAIQRRKSEVYQLASAQASATGSNAESVESVDGSFGGYRGSPRLHRWGALGESYSIHNPKNVQHLLSLLQQPGLEKLLFPNEDGDNPLHSIVRLPRPAKDKVELLTIFLTHASVDVNSHGKDGMTALHYAVQANDIDTVQVLLAFGADVNLTNHRHHTPLDIATYSWLAQERQRKVSRATNNMATVEEGTLSCNIESFPDVTSSPVPSPLLRRANPKVYARTGSTSSWIYVDKENGLHNGDSHTDSPVEESCTNSEDSREFTSSVMPIKPTDFVEEVLDGTEPSPTLHRKTSMQRSFESMLNLLYSVHAQSGKALTYKFGTVSRITSFSESYEFEQKIEEQKRLNPFWDSSDFENSVKIKDYLEGKTVLSLYEELEYNINLGLANQSSLSPNPDEAIAITFQQKEMMRYKRTLKDGIGFEVNGGSRLLFLDGGGIKGLVQIEVMRQLEAATGRRIIELFDWIIGTSIGGILALGMVYANKSLSELQQMCFKLKEEVFAKPRGGIAFNSKAMEKMITDEFGFNLTMSQIKRPKILIAAVNKRTTPPQLHFFNNCFADRFSNAPVWKVARYTSAAPMFFTEFEDYVDGGVLANNPCDYGLTAIQNYHREMHINLPISMVVSIGTGVYPPEEVGRIDAQEFLFFGKHWFSFTDNVKSRTQNLITLLTNALVESEIVAANCKMRCHEQNIPYYRFSPQLNHVISAGETDTTKLVDMILQARIQSPQQVAEVASLFQLVADAGRKNRYRVFRALAEPDRTF